mmetsp:Transcript_73392/g.192432  ORF Transcript_73392/g.192432 Transcript_73392/m.192432 type:complete len:682 (+) Transcript_73392:82-2127(+)
MGDALADFTAVASQWSDGNRSLFLKVLQNVVSSPQDVKFRRLKLTNPKIASLLQEPGAKGGLEALGWTCADGEFLQLPMEANLAEFASVLRQVEQSDPSTATYGGDPWVVTVMRGPLRTKLELTSLAPVVALSAAIEKSEALGRMPRARQRLLSGYPPRPVQELDGDGKPAVLGQLGLKTVLLEDRWEELVQDLRSGKATFVQLGDALSRPALANLVLGTNKEFVTERSIALLKTRIGSVSSEEIRGAAQCFRALGQSMDTATYPERAKFCLEMIEALVKKPRRQPTDGGNSLMALVQEAMEIEEEMDAAAENRFVLQVNRQDVLGTAISCIAAASPADLRRPVEIRFEGEAGEDAGGLRREFFNEFGRAMAQDQHLWKLTPAGSLVPVPDCTAAQHVPDEATRRSMYRICGQVVAMALCQAMHPPEGPLLLGVPLAKSFIRVVQGERVDALEALQAELNEEQHESAPDFRGASAFRERSLQELGLEGQLTFSYSAPGGEVVDLMPDGRNVVATDATKNAWLQATLRYELVTSVEAAASAFRDGVAEVIGIACLVLLTSTELCEAWSGRSVITDADLRTWQSCTETSPAVATQGGWFFELLSGELKDARARVLKFTTGSDRWPIDARGFRFCIEPADGADERLPCAMTCGNMLQLPRFTCRDKLRDRLLQAMELAPDLQMA